MIKIVFGFIFFLIIAEIQAQTADTPSELTMNEAVMGRWGAFYPNRTRSISWMNDQFFTFQKTRSKDTLFICNSQTHKVDVLTTLADLNKSTQLELSYLPSMNWITEDQCVFQTRQKVYYCNYQDAKWSIAHMISIPKGENIHFHRKSMQHAYTIDNNVYTQNNMGETKQVTRHEDPNIVAGQAIARSEFGIREGLFWSNTGAKLAFYQKDESNVGTYTLLDISSQPAKNTTIKYPMAGQASETAKLGIYDVATGKSLYLNVSGEKDQYITNFGWGPKDKYVYIAVVNRDQNKMRLDKYLAGNGTFVKTLFEETHEKYVEPENPVYFLPDQESFLWQSERDGYNHLYLYKDDGTLQLQVSSGNWVVKQILGISEDQKEVFFLGTSTDGMSTYVYSASLVKPQKPKLLIDDQGSKTVYVSNNMKQAVLFESQANVPHKSYYTSLSRIKKQYFHKAVDPFDSKKMGETKILTIRDASNTYDLNTRVIYPYDFDQSKTYPVLIYVYGGPHAQMVNASWMNAAPPWMHVVANNGFIVATVDNRGSANRGFDFENCIHRQLGEAEMADQMQLVKWLKGQKYVDPDRLAVHGWSYGGYMTISLLLNFPDVFKVGIAGGPVTDWHMYEVMYGERYMDRPDENQDGYETTNLSNKADQLNARLMMIHGTVDDVVVMQHSMQLVKAFVESGKRVDFMPYPMHPHNVRGKDRVHLMNTILDYLLSNIDR